MNFSPLKRYNLYFRKKNPYETSPKAQQFFNALYHFHKPYIFKVSCLKKKKKNKHLRNKSENTTIFLTHCTIFINHIFLKSPVAKSEKKKEKKKSKLVEVGFRLRPPKISPPICRTP